MAEKRIKDLSTEITSFRTGDFIAVDGPSGTAKMAKDDLLLETAENVLGGWGVGFFGKSLAGSDIENNGKYIVAPSGALSSNSNYRTSDKIAIYEGQKITLQARSPSLGAASMAVYAVDGTLRNIYVVSATEVTESFSHDCVADDSYVMFSCHNSYTSYLQASISSTGLQKDVEELDASVAGINSDLSALSTEVTKNSSDIEKVYSVGEFYKNAWVRYSDGLINPSTGGAKVYIIYRDQLPKNASKIIAKVCTESTTFCAIAFYSSKTPSTSTYMQSSSVQGITSTQTSTFQATLPQSWESAVVMNMSQHQATYSINLDVPNAAGIDEVNDIANEYANSAKALINLFSGKPCYHHLDPYQSIVANIAIPSQTLADVVYAKALGFSLIEANVHECSDGVFVCIHGSSGKLGKGLKSVDGSYTPEELEDMSFNAVTSTWLREKVEYNSFLKKYCMPIPTLDEFCAACKSVGLKIKFDNISALPVLRKYYNDSDLFFTGTNREAFGGLLEYVWMPSSKSIDDAISETLAKGGPSIIVIASGVDIYQLDLKTVCKKAHDKGILVGVVYQKTNGSLYALSSGVDVICSTYRYINFFSAGDILKLTKLDDERLVLAGSEYDQVNGVINMDADGSVIVPFSESVDFAKVSVSIRFSGTITIVTGINSDYYNLQEFTSDGAAYVNYAVALSPTTSFPSFQNAVKIIADGATVVYDLNVSASRTI